MNLYIILLSSFACFVNSNNDWNKHDYMKREHSLLKPYQSHGAAMPYWDFEGNTIITGNFIRLTPDLQSMRGGLWNNQPLNLINWEVQIQLAIHGSGKDLFGDGMAFWYTKEKMQPGPVFGSRDVFSGLGIFIDTYSNQNGEHNHEHPWVSAMVNHNQWSYDHDRDGTHTQLDGCHIKLRQKNHPTFLAIRYENNKLTVSSDAENKHQWKECFSVENVLLPTGYYMGFTAATGDLSDNHDIVSVRVYQLDETYNHDLVMQHRSITPYAASSEPQRDHVKDVPPSKVARAGSKFLTVIKWIFIVIFVGVLLAVGGYFAYRHFTQPKRKRLY